MIHVDPNRTALLIMDYQPAVLASVENPDSLLRRARAAADVARRHGVAIAYVRVGFTPDDAASVPPHSRMAGMIAAVGDRLHPDAAATQVHALLDPDAADITVRKTRIGAFSTTDLDERLLRAGMVNLILAGVTTSGVVLSTVREAHDLDYRAYVLRDACADPRTDVHDFLFEHVFPPQADVIMVGDLATMLADDRS